MCQVEEEYNGFECTQQIQTTSNSFVSDRKCMKCKEGSAVVIIRVNDAFCRSCFKEYFIHKFRAMLGKNRVIFPQEKVLLAVSGGAASCTMLDQVREGLSRDAPKKLRFVPGIIYIDEGGACGRSMEERQTSIAQLQSIFTETGFPYFIVPLEKVFSLPTSALIPGTSEADSSHSSYKLAVNQYTKENQTLREEKVVCGVSQLRIEDCSAQQTLALERLFSSLKTLTAKEEMLQMLRQHLILHVARENNFSKVMMGESCSRLAVKLLSNIAVGRGAALASDTGFCDLRFGDVVIVRPMRDYSSKEITFYSRIFRVPSVFIPGLDTKNHDKASIQSLTERFVTNLQADFPSTVSTIYRTSEKLQTTKTPQDQSAASDSKCLLCLCALDAKTNNASAFNATLISEQLSQRKLREAAVDSSRQCCVEDQTCVPGVCCSSNRNPAPTELNTFVCYSCGLMVRDMEEENSLPSYILTEAAKRQSRSLQKQQIMEFLLEDDD